MKKIKRSETGLVVEYLENISRTAIKRYPEIITDYARRRSGVYALYQDGFKKEFLGRGATAASTSDKWTVICQL